MLNTSEYYITANTALVAYLQLEGFSIVKIEHDGYQYNFVFENSNKRLAKCVEEFNTGRAIGNIKLYYINYKQTLEMIKEGRH